MNVAPTGNGGGVRSNGGGENDGGNEVIDQQVKILLSGINRQMTANVRSFRGDLERARLPGARGYLGRLCFSAGGSLSRT